jgi:hypothetical protein
MRLQAETSDVMHGLSPGLQHLSSFSSWKSPDPVDFSQNSLRYLTHRKATVDCPIQVYLDSSDFSNLANPATRTKEIVAVETFLVEMHDRGLLEIRFSEAHVTEASPVNPSAIPAGLARLSTIQRLCGLKCLSHPADLMRGEIDSVHSGDPLRKRRCAVRRDDGYWFHSAFRLGTILPTREELLTELVSKLPRETRRKFVRNEKFTRDAFLSLSSSLPNMESLREKLPLSVESIKVIESYYRGNRKLVDAERAIYASVAELIHFGSLFPKNWNQAHDLTKYLREESINITSRLKEQYEDIATTIEAHIENGLSVDQIERDMAEAFRVVVKTTGAKLAAKMAQGTDQAKILAADPWEQFPGIATASALTLHVAQRSARVRQSRAPKFSDFGDAYHAIYLPYVDVFRADAFIADVLRQCKLPFPTVVVDRFLDLPKRVQELIESRSKTMA